MKSILIKDTATMERIQIVKDAGTGQEGKLTELLATINLRKP